VVTIPRRFALDSDTRIDVVHSLFEPHGELMTQGAPGNILDLLVRIRLPNFRGAPRARNITFANYGDAVPEGEYVRNAQDVYWAYIRRHGHELNNDGALFDFVERSERVDAPRLVTAVS